MRVDSIRIGAFGRLHDFDTGPDPLEGLVVVVGPNEAGKSTLFTFLTTSLYGFHPASRELNPHVPWGTEEATGSVRLKLDASGCADIERTLRSQPSGKLTVDGRTTELRNQAVPWVAHVPRTVFRQVFAVTLGELAGLDGETWARIQDKVIGSMGAADLHSARAVAEVLEREAGEVWRPNRRGNQRLRDLQGRIRELRSRRSAAQERDARVRRLVEEREAVRDELRRVRELRQIDRGEVERAQSLLPVKRQLDRMATLREEGGPREALRGLPADPPAQLHALRAELQTLEERRQRLERELTVRRDTVARARDAGAVLDLRDEIVRLVAQAAGSAPDRVKAIELQGQIEDVEARLDAASEQVLRSSWRDVPTESLTAAPVELLRDRIHRSRSAAPGAEASTAWWGVLAAGAGLLVWGLSGGGPVPTAAGAAAAAAALTALWGRTGLRGDSAPAGADATSVARLLDGLPIRPDHLARPGEALLHGLERLRELVRRRGELAHALEAARERVARADASARGLADTLGRDASADAEGIARDLDHELREAERLRDAALVAERELGALDAELRAMLAKTDGLRAELDALCSRAAEFASGDAERGLEVARDRLAAHAKADQVEEELARSHPHLDDLRAQIEELESAESSWSVDDEALARSRARIEAHDESIERLVSKVEALEQEATHLRDLETVDAVDGEIASLRDEEARLTRDRDRKRVLAHLLRTADRRFREEHQPDLVRRAGSYLRHLTGGRYDRLVIDETHDDHLFHVVGPTLPAPVPLAPPVSTGTLEQAYLSLRLAIVDHLDQGGERLPLFIDEVFVNWDDDRRARGLEVLAGIASTRQVFVFTCHPGVAEELAGRGGRVLELAGG